MRDVEETFPNNSAPFFYFSDVVLEYRKSGGPQNRLRSAYEAPGYLHREFHDWRGNISLNTPYCVYIYSTGPMVPSVAVIRIVHIHFGYRW